MDFNEIMGLWDYTTLPRNISFGKNCWFERKASFERFRSVKAPGLIIGDGVKVYTWTTFNVEPGGVLEIGDRSILVGAVFMCADSIAIGKDVIVSYHVTIADSDFHPIDPELRKLDAVANAPEGSRKWRSVFETRPVIIEDDVQIGIGAIILKGTRVGKGARIGAGAVVTADVPPGVSVAGNPARIMKEPGRGPRITT
jgi:acetyltransferase-like isoleucine patch superfamily enzyme